MIGQAGIFGIRNSAVSLAVVCVLLVLVALWLALIYWTFADARRRIDDGMLVACATVLAIVPFIGSLIYLIVRPPEYLDDVRERELEIQAAEARLAGLDHHTCPYCDSPIEKDFLRCPTCMRKLKDPCTNCGRPLDPSWQICPYCEQAVAPRAQKSRRRRRSATQERSAERSGGGERGGSERGGGGGGGRTGGGQPRGGERVDEFGTERSPEHGFIDGPRRSDIERGDDGPRGPRAGSRAPGMTSDSDLI